MNESTFVRRSWQRKQGGASLAAKLVRPRLTLITALATDGRLWFALSHANTSSETMGLFLRKLVQQLELEEPGTTARATFLLDGAVWHTGEPARQWLLRLGLKTLYTSPYSY